MLSFSVTTCSKYISSSIQATKQVASRTRGQYFLGLTLGGIVLSHMTVAIANEQAESGLLPLEPPTVEAVPQRPNLPVGSFESETITTEYMFGAGDQIAIEVFDFEEFTGTWVVLPDGSIILPALGAVKVGGETPESLKVLLTEQLNRHLVDPVVTVRPTVLRPVVVTVAGEVHRPGPMQLRSLSESNNGSDGIPTISSALIEAGGVTQNADIQQIELLRSQPGREPVSITLNLWDSLWSSSVPEDLVLQDGDVVFVPQLPEGTTVDRRLIARSNLAPETIPVRVIGEIEDPGEISVSPDSSLSGAIAAAGGPTTDARLKRVELIRLSASGQIESQTVDLRNLDDDYQIQANDVIFVPERGGSAALNLTERILRPVLRIFSGISVIDRLVD